MLLGYLKELKTNYKGSDLLKIIDLHCDTILKIHGSKGETNLRKNDFHVDIEKLKKANSIGQFFAVFIEYNNLDEKYNNYFDLFLSMLDRLYFELEKNSDSISIAKNYKDLKENIYNDKISAFLTLEEGGIIENNLYNLRTLYRLGIRLITLTWNYPNSIGFPNSKLEYMNKGLTDFGKSVIEEMNRLGMIIDVSHLSDGGFYDVSKISKAPFIASHSNSRSVRNHPRNLTDDMIKVIANSGGIIGINFCPAFVDGSICSIEGLIKHITHIRNVGGIDVLSLGTDFDGIGGKLEIENIGQINKLINVLNKKGFSDDEIEKIAYGNSLRVIKEVMK